MFPSNEPAKAQPTPILPSTQGRRFQWGQVLFYIIIVVCWTALQVVTIMYPQFIYDGPVLASYLVKEEMTTNWQIQADPVLTSVDFYIKALLVILNAFVGTFFLVVFVLPKMQNKNIWILTLLMGVGYVIPLAGAAWNILVNQEFLYFVTVNKLLVTIINAPLVWSLILFGYYLYEDLAKA